MSLIRSAVDNRGLGGKQCQDAIRRSCDDHDGMLRADDDWLAGVECLLVVVRRSILIPYYFTLNPFFRKLVLFLPWCIAAGWTILFSPSSTHLTDRMGGMVVGSGGEWWGSYGNGGLWWIRGTTGCG